MPPVWIVLTALAGAGCALALTYLCLFRNAPLRDDMAEADDHPHPVPRQRGPVEADFEFLIEGPDVGPVVHGEWKELRVLHDSRVDGPLPEKLARIAS